MSVDAGTTRPAGDSPSPHGSVVPRRVTAPILRCLAAGLGLPTAASIELRQMIDGKLLEQGHEP